MAVTRTLDRRHAQLVRHHLGHLGVEPWPISVPPWFTSTVPSADMHQARRLVEVATLKLMPNFTGVRQSALEHRAGALKAAMGGAPLGVVAAATRMRRGR